MKGDTVSKALLFDYYGELLTETQKTYYNLYYNQDFSLGEIAEREKVSRQGVHDALSRAEITLRNLEEKTGCIARSRRLLQTADQLASAARRLHAIPDAQTIAVEVQALAESIKEIEHGI